MHFIKNVMQSDKSPLLIVFKWTLYELCILRHDFDQSVQCFKDDESRFVNTIPCNVGQKSGQSFRNTVA